MNLTSSLTLSHRYDVCCQIEIISGCARLFLFSSSSHAMTFTRKAARYSCQLRMPEKWLQKRFAGVFFLFEGRWKRHLCTHAVLLLKRTLEKPSKDESRVVSVFFKMLLNHFQNGGRPSGALMLYTTAAAYDLVESSSQRIQETDKNVEACASSQTIKANPFCCVLLVKIFFLSRPPSTSPHHHCRHASHF